MLGLQTNNALALHCSISLSSAQHMLGLAFFSCHAVDGYFVTLGATYTPAIIKKIVKRLKKIWGLTFFSGEIYTPENTEYHKIIGTDFY